MPSTLIVYETTDGQTARIARFVGDRLRALGIRVDVVRAGGASADPAGYDGVIVAASIHAGGYQRAATRWVRAHAAALATRPAAFLSVCLAALEDSDKARGELQRIKARFIRRTGWNPAPFKLVPGALPYTRYGLLKRWAMRRIVARAGGDTDTSRDYEYTDWNELRSFAAGFAGRVRPAAVQPLDHASELLPMPCVMVGAA